MAGMKKKGDGNDMLARMQQRVEEKGVTPEARTAAQEAANNESILHPIRMKKREQLWYRQQALKSKKTIPGVAREALRREFGEPPEDFNVPIDD